jgi:outer membrane assembly lipoprotein YfiO
MTVCLLMAIGFSSLGCSTLATLPEGIRKVNDQSIVKPITGEEIGDTRSPLARWLRPMKPSEIQNAQSYSSMTRGANGLTPRKVAPNPAADAELAAAEQIFQKGNYPEAIKALEKIAKDRKDSPWGEKAQYLVAEIYYQTKKYRYAYENYVKLVDTYPSSIYLEKALHREYAIADLWLASMDPRTDPKDKLTFWDRFNGALPIFDVNGFAIDALEKMQYKNPEDPLIEKAIMRIADHHYEQGNFELASITYDQIITNHPKSEFLYRAELDSIDSKIKAYLGPEYDGTGLEKAKELINQAFKHFPDRNVGNKDLYKDLDIINEAQAERTFDVGEFYERTGKIKAATYYFSKVVQIYPRSRFAPKAKEHLTVLAKLPRDKESKPSKIMATPGGGSGGGAGGGGGMGGMGGMGMMGMGGMGGMGGGMPGMGGPM